MFTDSERNAGHICVFTLNNAAFLNISPILAELLDVLYFGTLASPTHAVGFEDSPMSNDNGFLIV